LRQILRLRAGARGEWELERDEGGTTRERRERRGEEAGVAGRRRGKGYERERGRVASAIGGEEGKGTAMVEELPRREEFRGYDRCVRGSFTVLERDERSMRNEN
jgi:hypothetical protein